MGYAVKTIYLTLQGEGVHAGRRAVFLRFAACNLWSGRETDRETATCKFCDTDFVGTDGFGGGMFQDAASLATAVAQGWSSQPSTNSMKPMVVCTGGEPLLQLDEDLVAALQARGFEVAVETNGTRPALESIDWICVSPKANAPLVQTCGSELKLVYPQAGAPPEQFIHLKFDHFFLQPMDGPKLAENTRAAIEYCLRHPQWRLSVQLHKIVGMN